MSCCRSVGVVNPARKTSMDQHQNTTCATASVVFWCWSMSCEWTDEIFLSQAASSILTGWSTMSFCQNQQLKNIQIWQVAQLWFWSQSGGPGSCPACESNRFLLSAYLHFVLRRTYTVTAAMRRTCGIYFSLCRLNQLEHKGIWLQSGRSRTARKQTLLFGAPASWLLSNAPFERPSNVLQVQMLQS